MAKSNDIEFDLYCKHITNHSHCNFFPYNRTPDHKEHDNIQHTISFAFHDKSALTVNSFANSQTIFQKNLENNAHDNFQIEHQQSHLKFLN